MSLRENDLEFLVDKIVEIDSFKSKMGDDKDIIVIAFRVADKEPAEDLESFLEKGYSFILDADSTPGEQSDGMYKVYVEIERNRHAIDNIMEIMDGVQKLSNKDFKFRYYKNFRSLDLTEKNLEDNVPLDPEAYEVSINENNLSNYKNFFNNSYLEEIDLNENDELEIKKSYAQPLKFKVLDYGKRENIIPSLEENLNIDAYPEIIYLTKYIGDYAITKYGDKVVLENSGDALVVERIN